MKINVAVLALVTLPSTFLASKNCWKQAYGRGVGEVISTCRDGLDRNLAFAMKAAHLASMELDPFAGNIAPANSEMTAASATNQKHMEEEQAMLSGARVGTMTTTETLVAKSGELCTTQDADKTITTSLAAYVLPIALLG